MKKSKAILCVGLILILSLLTACSQSGKISKLLEEENYDEAVAQYNLLENPSSDTAEPFVKTLSKIYDDFKENAIEYSTAIEKINSIQKTNNSSVKDQCDTIKSKIDALNTSRTAYETGVDFENQKDYTNAIKQYSLVIEDDENYNTATEKIKSLSDTLREEATSSAKKYADDGDYENAIKELRRALYVLSNDSELTKDLSIYTESYVKDIITKVDSLVKDKKLDDATTLLNNALNIASNNKTLSDKLEEIGGLAPVGLEEVHVIDSKNYEYKIDVFEDSYGNQYSGSHYFSSLENSKSGKDNEPFALFNLNKEYTSFKGKIVPESTTDKNSNGNIYYVRIYADNKLVFEKLDITKTTEGIDVNINVNDCKQLCIRMGLSSDYAWWYNHLGIVNAVLEKI